MSNHFAYLGLNLLTLAGPLARSFEPRIAFHRRWFALLPAIGITGAGFIAWDALFTRWGVWGFNEDYLVGVSALGLPLEEWLFFLTVPYACTFIYDCLNHFWPIVSPSRWSRALALALAVFTFILGILNSGRMYTVATCLVSSACMGTAVWMGPRFLAAFFRTYAVCLVPFILVNGALTGSVTSQPIVWYDNAENLGMRIGSIPVEDAFYLLPLLWLVIFQYERRLAATTLDLGRN